MKTNKLTGAALDWAVAVAEYGYGADYKTNRYSTDWSQGGPIIEREGIELAMCSDQWRAVTHLESESIFKDGSTPLEAAMRCYCCAKLGDEVEIPTELTQGEVNE